MAFLIAPLRSREAEPALASPRAAHAAAERESVLAALRDLEEDFATGKLDAADHAQMRSELRARAAQLLAAERDARAAPAPVAPPAAASCPSCAAAAAPGARFCSNCGVRLDAPSARIRRSRPMSEPALRASGSASASAARWRWKASISSCPPARAWRCWGPTAPANRRCCG